MIAAAKREMRVHMIARRDALSTAVRACKSEAICKKLLKNFEYSHAHTKLNALEGLSVAVYQSLKSEVDLNFFIDVAYSQGVRVAFPCMMKKESTLFFEGTSRTYMVFREVTRDFYTDSRDVLVQSSGRQTAPFLENPLRSFVLGDPVLQTFPLVDAETFDMVIVPLVAFDSAGNRLGYGGGNYDLFLEKLSSQTQVVGVGFTEQEVEQVPIEVHDKALSRIIIA